MIGSAAALIAGCSAGSAPDQLLVEHTGSVGLELQAGDVSLSSVAYDISGNGFQRSGTIDVSGSKTLSAMIGGVPAGTGYVITLSAVAESDPSTTCAGQGSVDVTPAATSTALITLLCQLPKGNGRVQLGGRVNVCPRIDSMSINPSEVFVGSSMALSATITDSDAAPAAATYAWTSSAGELVNATSPNATFTCTAPGTVSVTLEVSDGDCSDVLSADVICSEPDVPPPPPAVRLNEIESSGGTPGDWVELYNAEAASVDVSGWSVRDNDDTHIYTIPSGTSVAAGGYLVIEEASLGFGLGSGDSARLFDATGTLVDSHSWAAHAATSYGRCPNGSGAFTTSTSVTKGAANDCSVPVKLNEVESSGGTPGDWVELYNAGSITVDLSNFLFRDSDDTRAYTIPAGTTLAPGVFLVLDEAVFGFGLGAADSARLFDASGALVDSYAWTVHAATTYGRCPDGSGDFTATASATKAAGNACPVVEPPLPAWPGTDDVQTADGAGVFQGNLSGLTYQPASGESAAVLWAVRNGPGTLYRLLDDGTIWTPDATNDWSAGKALHYTDGTGNPDAEGVTLAELDAAAIYVATERNNDASTLSRMSVLRYDTTASGAALVATHDWNLTSDLPAAGANLGLEAITWVPDSALVARGFRDEATGAPYDPASYPNHGGGLFFVGVEGTGMIHAYALDHSGGGFQRVATIASGNPGVMGLEYDRDHDYLWVSCDDTCGNETGILDIDTNAGSPTFGRFQLVRQFQRPATLPNLNNEGIAFAPEAECSNGTRAFFWTDDSETDGHSLRRDAIPCGPLL